MSSADRLECIDPEVGELLPFHVDGQLDPEDRRIVVAHLQACAACAEEEALLRRAVPGIASLRARPHPDAALDPAPLRRRASARTLIAASVALAALVAAAAAWWPRATPHDEMANDLRSLETRVQHLESQNALLAHSIATERTRAESSPLTGIRVAAPPNL